MWVEVEHDKVATSFNKYDKIRVVVERGHAWEGLFLKHEVDGEGGHYVHLTQSDLDDQPITLYVWKGRKFYYWVEDKPTDSHNQLDVHVDQSKLRLNKPAADLSERGKRLHDHVGKLIEEQKGESRRQVASVVVGRQMYALHEGDHLRVWWEDGALWSELVQERTK